MSARENVIDVLKHRNRKKIQMLARIRKATQDSDQGFTLIELLVVIIIIGILAAIAIPTFLNQREKGWDAAAKSDIRNMQIAAETAATSNDEGLYPTTSDGIQYKTSAGVESHGYTSSDNQKLYCVIATSRSGAIYGSSGDSQGVVKATGCANGVLTT